MNHAKPNLFSSLYRWAHSQGENFCTEALVWVINLLLEKNERAGLRLLARICFNEKKNPERLGKEIKVRTQVHTESHGIPDILIESNKLLAIVEVKVGAGLEEGQLAKYATYLKENKKGREGQLILLELEKASTSEDDASLVDHHWRWFEVGDWLRKDDSVEDQVAKEIKDEFVEFLQEQHMCLKAISEAMPKGLSSLMDFDVLLHAVLDDAANENQISIGEKDRAHTAMGYFYFLDGEKYWVGINFATPEYLDMPVFGKVAERDALEARGFKSGVLEKNDNRRQFPLDAKFYDSTIDQQQKVLSDFVTGSFDILREVLRDSNG